MIGKVINPERKVLISEPCTQTSWNPVGKRCNYRIPSWSSLWGYHDGLFNYVSCSGVVASEGILRAPTYDFRPYYP